MSDQHAPESDAPKARYRPGKPAPTTCPHCGYQNGGAFSVCPICKQAIAHAPIGRSEHQLSHPCGFASSFPTENRS